MARCSDYWISAESPLRLFQIWEFNQTTFIHAISHRGRGVRDLCAPDTQVEQIFQFRCVPSSRTPVLENPSLWYNPSITSDIIDASGPQVPQLSRIHLWTRYLYSFVVNVPFCPTTRQAFASIGPCQLPCHAVMKGSRLSRP